MNVDAGSGRTATHVRAWLREFGRDTFDSWDFKAAALCGAGALVASLSQDVRDASIPVLITEAAVGVALTSTVLGGMAIFATFFDGAYRMVLDAAGGFRRALMPYAVVAAVAALATIVGTLAALALPALGRWPQILAIGASTLFCAWAVFGAVALVELTVWHAGERARLLRGVDEAAAIRAQRLRGRSEEGSAPEGPRVT
jgi:hypothetical protein